MDKKRLVKIIITCVFLLASCALLLTFFILSSSKNSKPLTVYANDRTMYLDETLTNFFTVSESGFNITFEIENESVVTIEDKTIFAHSPGRTKVTITAELNDKIAKTSFYITVYARSYSYEIIPVDGCKFEDNSLVLFQEICQFSLNIYDELNKKVIIDSIKFYKPDEVVLQLNINSILIVANKDCVISININNSDFVFELNILIDIT